MAKNVEHVSHIKSKLKTNGLPQLPTADKLVDGEIAINYAEGVETISIRNENSAITTFSSDNYYTEKKLGSGFTNNDATVTEAIDDLEYMVVNKEEAIAAALNDLNGRKLDASAYTPTDLSNYYAKGETSGATEIQTALNSKVDTTAFTNHTSSSVHMTTTEKTNLDSLATNIAAISGITATKVSNWDDANTKKHTHSNKTALDSITSNVGTMAYENASSYSSATQVSTALSNKVDKTEYATFSATTNTSIEDLSGQSETVAAALNDLNDKIRTAQTALNSKADKTVVDDLSRQSKTIAAALNDLNARLSELSEKLK